MALDIELYGNDEMVCPYCKSEQSDSWEYLMHNKESGTAECGTCLKTFHWEAIHSTTYTTQTVEETND